VGLLSETRGQFSLMPEHSGVEVVFMEQVTRDHVLGDRLLDPIGIDGDVEGSKGVDDSLDEDLPVAGFDDHAVIVKDDGVILNHRSAPLPLAARHRRRHR
jgi:hypothetical protein